MIENIELLAFIKDNLAFARTIVIKNEDLAILDNTLMYQHQKLTPSADKSKWRYYLNLNGEYHSTDEVMFVRSLDDNENIEFTKANLELHPATKKAYRLGSYYFSRLVALYPHQMELIQGIINPIPPEESIPAKNYQILRYTKDYVQWNESQLIPELQKHIDQIVYQSFNTEYKYTDDLMLPLLITHLHESIFKFLLQNRFENRYTRHAHSFYIWSYLQSKGISPIYKDLLNNKQTMWLFRNINYVLRNLGKKTTFEQLINILLTERNIPIAKYDLIQSTETITTNLVSEPLFYSERLNLIETRGLGQSVNKLAITMLKEVPEALDNELYYDPYLKETEYDFTFGELNNFPIKILDSELVDTTNRKPETIFHVLNNELIYLAGNDLYNINLDIEEPLSGIHQRISVKDAIVLWHHLLNSYNGASCDQIPQFYYKDVLKIVPPTVSKMLSVGAKPFLTEAWCNDALKLYIPQIRMISPSTFYENSLSIFNLKWKHKKMYSRWLSIGYYSRRKNAISTMYETGYMKLTDKKSYAEFLEQFDFDFSSYRKEDYFSLMWEIWKKATGWDQFSHVTIAQIQEGMIGLMKFLSSYTIQFIHQTKVESGWYEGGLDLFTENPSLLNPNRNDGQPELENDVESSRIPVHHRVVMIKNEEEETLTVDESLYAGTISSELEENGEVYETPKLYDVTLSDTDKDDGFHSSHVMTIDYKLRNFTGELPYNLEDLIPKGGNNYDKHTLKELIVDTFEGLSKVGPWEAIGIKIVNNKIDNENVADKVENYTYEKIVDTKTIDENTNKYYVGFSPKETGEHLIKLDIIIKNTETEKLSTIRFDYNTITKKNTWVVTFDIPQSISLNVPFEITPTITGLMLGRAGDIEEKYIVDESISEFLSVENNNGKPMGTFLKEGWPEELPVLYIMTTNQGGDDPEESVHTYFMKGYIPSDRYYDPLTDPLFEPKIRCNEADPYAITLENFSVGASSHGWEPTNLYLKKDENGQYPTDLVKTDYNGIIDFLSPTLSSRKYVDETVNGEVIRTFEWYYAVDSFDVSLDMVIELTNQDDGSIVLKEFKYSPKVVDHGAQCELNIYPEENFKFGINYSSETILTVTGLSENIDLYLAENPVIIPDQEGKVAIDYFSDKIENNKIYSYSVRPYELLTQDLKWATKLEGMTKALNGEDLIILPYSTFTILKSDVVDYNVVDTENIKLTGWENSAIYAHAIIPSRYLITDSDNGWQVTSLEIVKTNNSWPSFFATSLPGVNSSTNITGFDPVIKMGVGVDGEQQVPAGYDRWFTIYALGNRDYLKGEDMELEIPIKAVLSNKFTGKTSSTQLNPKNDFVAMEFPATRTPGELVAGQVNHIVPNWTFIPLDKFGEAELISNEGMFVGVDKYKGQNGLGDSPEVSWNADDSTADITLPAPPLANGLGVIIYNKKVYRSKDTRFANSSVQDVEYYPYITYDKSEIMRVPAPTLEELDFTNIGNVDFFKGVRSTYVTLYNPAALSKYKWAVKSVNLEVYNTDEQDDYIITKIDDTALDSYIYKTGTQANKVDDAPDGKSNYSSAYVGFVPAKEGKQKFGVLMVLQNQLVSGIEPKTYRYEIEIDVNAEEGKVVYNSSYSDPWWLIGEETFALTDLEDYTGNFNSKKMAYATINNKYSDYVSIRTAGSSPLGLTPTLAVTVPERFTDVTPETIVVEALILNGYVTTDPRRTRHYFGLLPIKSDHLYNIDEITLEEIGFEPDVTFNPMRQNESYTERYIYNMSSKGWTVKLMRLQENQSWMNHFFTYDDQVFVDNRLGRFTSQDITIDRDTKAPDGKYYYLPRYGGHVVGDYDVSIQISLINNHNSKTNTKLLNYKTSRTVEESNIRLNLTYDNIYAGKKSILNGDIENIPTSDLHNGMVSSQYYFNAVGTDKKYFTLYKTNPKAISVSESYPLGNGKGILLAMAVPYDQMKSGIMETETWIRAYRGEQIIPDSDIVEYVDYPSQEDFDFTLLGNVDFYQGVRSTAIVLFNTDIIKGKGWTVDDVSMPAFGSEEQDNVFITKFDSKDLTEKVYSINALETLPSDTPDAKKNYNGYSFSFMPAKSGEQVFEIALDIINGKYNKRYIYQLKLNVAEKQGEIRWSDSDNNPWWLVGKETYYLTDLYNTPDTLTSSVFESVELNDKNASLVSASLKVNSLLSAKPALAVLIEEKTTGFDPNVIAIYQAVFSGYEDNDPRAIKYYIDMLPIYEDHQYYLEDLDSTIIDLEPDIVFEEMKVNQVYTERYTYTKAGNRGWEPSTIKPIEDQSWMAHVFEYGGETKTSENLFYYISNKTYDHANIAPTGKCFFMPTYGSRKVGDYNLSVDINLINRHFKGALRSTVNYSIQRKIIDSPFALELKYEELYIGRKTELQGGMANIPDDDVNQTLIPNVTNIVALGINAEGISVSANPYAIEIKSGYKPSTEKGFMVAVEVLYNKTNSIDVSTDTQHRAYVGTQIIPKEAIVEYVSFPKLEDIDFTNIGNVDFFKGVRSTYITLYNTAAPNDDSWWISKIDLDVVGTDRQDDYIITKIDGNELGSLAYNTDNYPNQNNDAPEGKGNYYTIATTFIPAKEGKQKFGVTATVTVDANSGYKTKDYHFDIEIDVKPKEGKITYDSSEPNPWWVLNEETYALTEFTGYSGTASNSYLTYVSVVNEFNKYLTAKKGVNNALGADISLGVTIKEKFTNITPKIIVAYQLTLSNYSNSDARNTRIYFDTVEIDKDYIYDIDEITLETIEFKEDVGWENKLINQSYYDRYVYNIETKGWTVKTVSLVENINWMNNYFEFGSTRIRNAFLINTNKYNYLKDINVNAPEGKQFYLPLYGSRKEGIWPTYINVLLYNKHLSNGKTKQLTYRKDINYVASNIKLNFTNETYIIGENNTLTGGMEGVPAEDIREGMVLSSDGFTLNGNKSSYFTPYKNPYKINIKNTYEEGSGNGINLMIYQLYGAMQSGWALGSYTWVRGYRGQQTIDESSIIKKVEYPEISDFNLTALPSNLIQGVVCTLSYLYDIKTISDKGWGCDSKGLSAYGKNNQSEVMIDNIEGKTFDNGYLYNYGDLDFTPSDAPDKTSGYKYGYVSFVPAKEGKQTINITLTINRGNISKEYTFPIEIDVQANEGVIKYSSKNAEPWYFLDYGVGLETELSGYSGTLTSNEFTLATMIPRDESYFTVVLNNPTMTITSIKDVEDTDRGVIVGRTVNVTGYDDNDKRGVRTYYDVIWIDNTHVYSLDNLKPALVDLQKDVVFGEMNQYTSYTERYSYLRTPPSGWTVESTNLVEDKTNMNHIFEYDNDTSTNGQLFSGTRSRLTYDRDNNAPSDRWYSLPTYGYRNVGEFEVTFQINIATTQFGRRMTGKIEYKQTRKVIDAGVKVTATYDQLKAGQSNNFGIDRSNIPGSDIKPGVIMGSLYTNRTGSNYSYFTYKTNSLTITSGYPVGNGKGVMLGFIYPYTVRQAGHNAHSDTDNRVYRGQVIIPDSDIS